MSFFSWLTSMFTSNKQPTTPVVPFEPQTPTKSTITPQVKQDAAECVRISKKAVVPKFDNHTKSTSDVYNHSLLHDTVTTHSIDNDSHDCRSSHHNHDSCSSSSSSSSND